MSGGAITESSGSVSIRVRVTPRSSRNAVAGLEGEALKIKLTAPPVEGAANAALAAFIADWLGVRKSKVSIIRGGKSRTKIVRIEGVTAEQVKTRLRDIS
jgi:uncharacterized protein (TIGR00251 family)